VLSPDKSVLEQVIKNYRDPYLDKDLFELNAIDSLEVNEGKVSLAIVMGYPCTGITSAMTQILTSTLEQVAGVSSVAISVTQKVVTQQAQKNMKSLPGVKNIIAIASGKGGVGKSTTAVNLALAMAKEGAKVGILDADIYGPSVGMMIGVKDGERPEPEGDKYMKPLIRYGIQAMSMAFLIAENTPMVWRGPMVSGALQQLLTQTHWRDLDYLFIDMPPGTGDIQLTLSQHVPVTGAVIVTTPQDIALLDCQKGIEMFRKVEIPVLGVIENMSMHICSECGHHDPLFGEGGGEKIANQYHTDLLGQLPLHRAIREQTDSGSPMVTTEPDSEISMIYRDIARKMAASLSIKEPVASMEIVVENN